MISHRLPKKKISTQIKSIFLPEMYQNLVSTNYKLHPLSPIQLLHAPVFPTSEKQTIKKGTNCQNRTLCMQVH